jgi:hypothetical protein
MHGSIGRVSPGPPHPSSDAAVVAGRLTSIKGCATGIQSKNVVRA